MLGILRETKEGSEEKTEISCGKSGFCFQFVAGNRVEMLKNMLSIFLNTFFHSIGCKKSHEIINF